jgi:hypothetical protein
MASLAEMELENLVCLPFLSLDGSLHIETC